jgi:hypothetical protein
MKIYRTMLGLDNGGGLFLMDTIEHEGALWLVPDWIVFHDEKVQKPRRIIRLDGLKYQKTKFGKADYVLNDPLPSILIDPAHRNQQLPGYVVKEAPDIQAPVPSDRLGGDRL